VSRNIRTPKGGGREAKKKTNTRGTRAPPRKEARQSCPTTPRRSLCPSRDGRPEGCAAPVPSAFSLARGPRARDFAPRAGQATYDLWVSFTPSWVAALYRFRHLVGTFWCIIMMLGMYHGESTIRAITSDLAVVEGRPQPAFMCVTERGCAHRSPPADTKPRRLCRRDSLQAAAELKTKFPSLAGARAADPGRGSRPSRAARRMLEAGRCSFASPSLLQPTLPPIRREGDCACAPAGPRVCAVREDRVLLQIARAGPPRPAAQPARRAFNSPVSITKADTQQIVATRPACFGRRRPPATTTTTPRASVAARRHTAVQQCAGPASR
jgi:hypothetical protein